jgi:hypothetical protein
MQALMQAEVIRLALLLLLLLLKLCVHLQPNCIHAHAVTSIHVQLLQ